MEQIISKPASPPPNFALSTCICILHFIGPKSDHRLASATPRCETLVETWLVWPWRVKIRATSPCLTNCCQLWQRCCWCRNNTKDMLLMSEQNKSLCISSFAEQTNLKLDQDFKACWSFCFELNVFDEVEYSMCRVQFAFGNVFTTIP